MSSSADYEDIQELPSNPADAESIHIEGQKLATGASANSGNLKPCPERRKKAAGFPTLNDVQEEPSQSSLQAFGALTVLAADKLSQSLPTSTKPHSTHRRSTALHIHSTRRRRSRDKQQLASGVGVLQNELASVAIAAAQCCEQESVLVAGNADKLTEEKLRNAGEMGSTQLCEGSENETTPLQQPNSTGEWSMERIAEESDGAKKAPESKSSLVSLAKEHTEQSGLCRCRQGRCTFGDTSCSCSNCTNSSEGDTQQDSSALQIQSFSVMASKQIASGCMEIGVCSGVVETNRRDKQQPCLVTADLLDKPSIQEPNVVGRACLDLPSVSDHACNFTENAAYTKAHEIHAGGQENVSKDDMSLIDTQTSVHKQPKKHLIHRTSEMLNLHVPQSEANLPSKPQAKPQSNETPTFQKKTTDYEERDEEDIETEGGLRVRFDEMSGQEGDNTVSKEADGEELAASLMEIVSEVSTEHDVISCGSHEAIPEMTEAAAGLILSSDTERLLETALVIKVEEAIQLEEIEADTPLNIPSCEGACTLLNPPSCEGCGTLLNPPSCEEAGTLLNPPSCEEAGTLLNPPSYEEAGTLLNPPSCEEERYNSTSQRNKNLTAVELEGKEGPQLVEEEIYCMANGLNLAEDIVYGTEAECRAACPLPFSTNAVRETEAPTGRIIDTYTYSCSVVPGDAVGVPLERLEYEDALETLSASEDREVYYNMAPAGSDTCSKADNLVKAHCGRTRLLSEDGEEQEVLEVLEYKDSLQVHAEGLHSWDLNTCDQEKHCGEHFYDPTEICEVAIAERPNV